MAVKVYTTDAQNSVFDSRPTRTLGIMALTMRTLCISWLFMFTHCLPRAPLFFLQTLLRESCREMFGRIHERFQCHGKCGVIDMDCGGANHWSTEGVMSYHLRAYEMWVPGCCPGSIVVQMTVTG